jgi:tellurite resistance protein TerC
MVTWMWVGFVLFVLAMLAIDLGVFHRKAHSVSIREALGWSVVWITLALVFNVFIYFAYDGHWLELGRARDGSVATDIDGVRLEGHAAAIKFFTGYVIEKSLSVDNLFVMALIFAYFRIPSMYQHRVLFWGILGALIMRGFFIGLGAALIAKFHWILYLFGAFLIYTGYKMLTADEDPDPSDNPLIKLARKYFPITTEMHGQHFLVRRDELRHDEPVVPCETTADPDCEPEAPAPPPLIPAARLPEVVAGTSKYVLTPLALTLIVVEGTDLVFAVDSIPAIFAITGDPFLVFTSNVFAILGLRALYFALAGILDKFYYLKTALALVLALVGVKMLVADFLKKNEFFRDNLSFITLGMIALLLGGGVIASLVRAKRHPHESEGPPSPADGPAGARPAPEPTASGPQ